MRSIGLRVGVCLVCCAASVLCFLASEGATSEQETDVSDLGYGALLERAVSGDFIAQYYLGLMYLQGRGVPQDNWEAVRWRCANCS